MEGTNYLINEVKEGSDLDCNLQWLTDYWNISETEDDNIGSKKSWREYLSLQYEWNDSRFPEVWSSSGK